VTDKPTWKQRYAAHLGLRASNEPLFLRSAGSGEPVAQIDYLASIGFAGIEDNMLKTRPPETQAKMGETLVRHGMQMGCFVNNPNHWNQPLWGRADPDAREQLAHDLDESIEAAKRTGGRYTTVVSGCEANIPIGFQRANMVENLKRLAEKAEKAGLVFVIETVNARNWPNMILHHIGDAYQVVKAVGSPAVKLVFDTGHVAPMDGDVLGNLTRAWDEIAILQVADNPDRAELGQGELNWINIFRTIKGLGYTGLTELEFLIASEDLAGEQRLLKTLRAIDDAL
jgi:hydroxypyruvate isomerase